MAKTAFITMDAESFFDTECVREKDGDFLLYLHPFELYGGEFPKIKGVKSVERYYLNAGRKDYKDKIIKILDALIAAGYEFETPCGYIKKHGGIVNV